MEISLPWGGKSLKFIVPNTWSVLFPKKKYFKKGKLDELKIVQDSLKKPIKAKRLADLDLGRKKILIIVDDNTRPTPVHAFFHLVLSELKRAGAKERNITLMTALGIHTPMTEDEIANKAGAKNLKKIKWLNHDAFNSEIMHDFGLTGRGTPVKLNRAVAEADMILSIGMIEPHLWAGFGGGLKNLLPGVASAECIGMHHSIIAEPPYLFNRVGMLPEKNSFRIDLEEIRHMIDADIYCLNVVLDHKKRIVGSFFGDPVESHRMGVDFNIEVSGLHMEEQVDGIIVNSYPMDINFKQSMKGVGNSLPALKPGGTVMAFLRAERGIDDITPPEDSKPLWLVKFILRVLGPSRVLGFLERVKKDLNVEEKFLIYYSMQLIRQYELYFYVPSLTDSVVKKLGFFRPSPDPQGVIDMAQKKLGKYARIAVFTEAGATFPIVGSG